MQPFEAAALIYIIHVSDSLSIKVLLTVFFFHVSFLVLGICLANQL